MLGLCRPSQRHKATSCPSSSSLSGLAPSLLRLHGDIEKNKKKPSNTSEKPTTEAQAANSARRIIVAKLHATPSVQLLSQQSILHWFLVKEDFEAMPPRRRKTQQRLPDPGFEVSLWSHGRRTVRRAQLATTLSRKSGTPTSITVASSDQTHRLYRPTSRHSPSFIAVKPNRPSHRPYQN